MLLGCVAWCLCACVQHQVCLSCLFLQSICFLLGIACAVTVRCVPTGSMKSTISRVVFNQGKC